MSIVDLVPTEAVNELFYLRVYSKIDRRTTACRVRVERDGDVTTVHGYSIFPQTDRFIRDTAEKTFAPETVAFDLKVLTRDYPVAFQQVITRSAPFYKDPVVVKEDLLTEALYGSFLRTFFEQDGFVLAQHPDGYVGYVPAADLKPATDTGYLRWKNGPCAILREPVPIGPEQGSGEEMLLPPTTRLVLDADGLAELPTGRKLFLQEKQYVPNHRNPEAFARALEAHAASFENTPYLWGGKTQAGIDCSGFVQSIMIQEGIFLPRDASMQAYVGEIVGYLPDYEDLLPGDMVFFMNDLAHIYHVGVYLGNRTYLHSSGSLNIIRSSFEKDGPNYAERYGGTFVFGRRLR